MKIPIENDFYTNLKINSNNDINYAIEKFLGKDHKHINKMFQSSSIFWFLENISHIGVKAFIYYIIPVFSYLKEQSVFWDENYWVFDERNIDGEAPNAFAVLPEILEKKIDKYPVEMQVIINDIRDFINWTIENYNLFYKDCFLDENIEERYKTTFEKIKKLYDE